jgi:hypothetical protein
MLIEKTVRRVGHFSVYFELLVGLTVAKMLKSGHDVQLCAYLEVSVDAAPFSRLDPSSC